MNFEKDERERERERERAAAWIKYMLENGYSRSHVARLCNTTPKTMDRAVLCDMTLTAKPWEGVVAAHKAWAHEAVKLIPPGTAV